VFQISVLGPIEVRRDGQAVRVPGGKASELLVRLALETDQVVRTDQLVDDLWAAGAPNTRRNTLQSKIARLRRALGDSVITSGHGGYRLAVDPVDVDALTVLNHSVAATRLFDAGDDHGAEDLCLSALRMFQGEVLQGAGDGDWVAPFRARLVEARMKLVETQLSARLRLGDVGDVIGELEAAVVTYPFQEGLWCLLITALYRAGRQADALATYQRVRRLLSEELGLDPGPQLQLLEQRILVHDASLGVPDLTSGALDRSESAGNLPSMTVELVGRETELATVCDLVDDSRLVEVVGPGGVGKTALALAAGRKLTGSSSAPGGAWLVRLESATKADEVVDAVIAALNVVGGEAALFERIKGNATLVVLDNCEHVIDAAAELAVRLLDAAPRLRILCTSQVPLDVDGEALFELAPLSLSDAVELFSRRASTRRQSQDVVAGEDLIRELCRSLDGLPLAVELAAARTKTLSIEEITRRLDDRFSVLADPTSRKPERRRALRATIGWSYELLFPDDKRGLWALAAFPGGASLSAVEFVLEALAVPASAAIDVIGRLASRSLVGVDDDDPSLPVRYRLLDSIRAFSLDAMADAGLSEHALAAQAEWFARAAASSTQGVRSVAQAKHLSFVRAERANIDGVLAWTALHDPGRGVDIVNGFGWAWIVLGDSRGAQRIMTALDAAGDRVPDRDRATGLLLASWIEASTGDLELARDHIAMASRAADAIEDVDLQAQCCYYLAYVVSHHGEWERALELTGRSRELYDGLDRPWDQAANALFASRAAISAGDEQRGLQARDDVEHWLGVVDDPWLHVRRDAMLGELARVQHRFDDAVLHLSRAAETSHRLGFRQTEAYQVSSLGRAQCQAGDYETGATTLELAVGEAETIGDVRLAALARVHLGRVLRALGQRERAKAALDSACAWHRDVGGGEQAALGVCLVAAMDAEDGVPGAGDRLRAILDEALLVGDGPVEVFALDALARLAVEAGDIVTAHELCATADQRMEQVSHFISEFDRIDARSVRQIA